MLPTAAHQAATIKALTARAEHAEAARAQAEKARDYCLTGTKAHIEALQAEIAALKTQLQEARHEQKTRPAPPARQVACTGCFVHGRECDDGEPCFQCMVRHRGHRCCRMQCKKYDAGMCRNEQCELAHETDGYARLTGWARLKRIKKADDDVDQEMEDGEIGG
ncbi:hypothetical protein BDV95DRAFT_612616 [Massariosphaeria phaeospora]|uniref:C3H1-type domain-containing protein n=1 Tax=Massariosphaeria phaeospora TaxID=100035 RepID=A0A7C8I2U7_9PLEO|nr:hypothetical protein BDV95DRAFT_612616 [Massariosphaeria phaeospora]